MTKKTQKKPVKRPLNPSRSRRERVIKERADGWISAMSGQGTAKDKRQYQLFQAIGTNYVENTELWRGDDLAGRIVETVPNEMLREGWELVIEGERGKEMAEEVKGLLEDLCVDRKLWQALCYENAYGGAGLLVGTNDGKDLSTPLDVSKISSLNFLETFEPQELQADRWQNDPTQKGFGSPVTYRLNPNSRGGSTKYGVLIHASRLAVFPGIQVSRRQITSQAGWGDAILSRCRETLRDFQTSWAAAGLLVADFAQAVWKIKGLAEIIALDKDEAIHSRIRAMELARSTVRAAVIDADGEEFERKQTPVSGLPELLDRFATRLAASANIPVTLLMGISPAGLNATGESDIRSFYDRVKSQQNLKLRPAIEKMCVVAFHALGHEEPENWFIRFRPLWQPTDKEVAEARKIVADTDAIYVDLSVLGADEVREQRFGGREYSMETRVEPVSELDVTEVQSVVGVQSAAPAGENIQATVLNGAQVSSLVEVVKALGLGEISRASAKAIISLAYQVPAAQAEQLVGPEAFKPAIVSETNGTPS